MWRTIDNTHSTAEIQWFTHMRAFMKASISKELYIFILHVLFLCVRFLIDFSYIFHVFGASVLASNFEWNFDETSMLKWLPKCSKIELGGTVGSIFEFLGTFLGVLFYKWSLSLPKLALFGLLVTFVRVL